MPSGYLSPGHHVDSAASLRSELPCLHAARHIFMIRYRDHVKVSVAFYKIEYVRYGSQSI